MTWEYQLKNAESLLASASVPPSAAIISSIKRVNPTRLCLPDTEKERGYELKSRLQNLLLENYGEVFKLLPHPCDGRVVLIKHLFLPSIDACHAHLDALSVQALDRVAQEGGAQEVKAGRPKRERGRREAKHETAPRETLALAQRLLYEYDYAGAERELAALRVTTETDLVMFIRGIRMLFEEVGAYRTAIDTLLAQTGRVLQEKSIRELLALAYYGNGSLGEAGAVFDSLHPADLGKEGLCAYAALALKDGNLIFARKLLHLAQEKDGFVDGLSELERRIEKALVAELEPVLESAAAALARGELDSARELASEVLASGNMLPKARRIVVVADCCAVSTEVECLWRMLERSVARGERVQVLQKLLDLDHVNGIRIRELMQSEQDAERRELVERKMDALRAALTEEKWGECFAALRWFARREDAGESYRYAASLSPLFQVLYGNQRLERLPERAAEALWLDFVEAVSLRRSGHDREALQILTRIRTHFRSLPYFEEQYAPALAAERQAEREELQSLLSKAQAEGCSFADVAAIQKRMRRVATYLAPDERSSYLSSLEARVEELRPVKNRAALLDQYETAMWMGDAERGALLAAQINDAAATSEIDKKVFDTLRIVAMPVDLTVSPELQVDVEKEHPGVNLYMTTDRHVCLRTGKETLIFIDLREMSAWLLQSRFFCSFLMQDYDSDRNLFLFRYGRDGEYFFRLVLDGAKSRFQSVVQVNGDMWPGSNLQVSRLFLSGGKEHEYFCVLYNADKERVDRVFKFATNNYKNPSATLCMKGEPVLGMERMATDPDTFIVVSKTGAALCNKNLSWPRLLPFGDFIYGVDRSIGKIYYRYEIALMAGRLTDSTVDCFRNALMAGFLWPQEVLGLSPQENKMLLCFKDDQGTLYNLNNNTLSTQFRMSTIFCTAIPSRFYYVDYDETYSWMCLRELTGELDTMLKWKEMLFANEPQETYVPKLDKLREGVDLVREALAREAEEWSERGCVKEDEGSGYRGGPDPQTLPVSAAF